ncbi:MAG: hypothetical protein NZ805_08095 [Armatimonadetes bacterium]|nr:hypothetical protein [Armatimonadota bacterium]MDW8029188.1 hypothetical protein [Armatimonadota bacterium]
MPTNLSKGNEKIFSVVGAGKACPFFQADFIRPTTNKLLSIEPMTFMPIQNDSVSIDNGALYPLHSEFAVTKLIGEISVLPLLL